MWKFLGPLRMFLLLYARRIEASAMKTAAHEPQLAPAGVA